MKLRCLLYTICLLLACATVQAKPTDITVYVKAKGSKFIGSNMGGARIVLTDARTGRILAEGKTAGGTDDTKRIMKTPLRSIQPLSSQDAAHYTATIDLEEPTRVRVEAYGPLAQPQSTQSASATQGSTKCWSMCTIPRTETPALTGRPSKWSGSESLDFFCQTETGCRS